ncbi:trehalose-6-phosphate synthase [Streptomyces sp. SID6673]|nr:trehalose-6-phosphate synthase [Streptomyces sp. SID11726]NDZ94889.1 trehalose-6-phosphate synthase [Streptomyces sp. SID11726]NEB23049.1 trehalose-6-phosphate synthase [Streptomyces sp. SID6673]
MAPKIQLDPGTIGALNQLVSMSPALDLYRESMAKQLAPALAAFNQANSLKMDVLAPELARTASTLVDLSAFTQNLATSPGMQALADSVRSYQQFDSIVSPQLAEAMRGVIATSVGTEEFARKFVQAPGFAETLQNIASINVQVGNFAEMYAKITEPLAETLRAAYEGTKFLDGFDFSVLDDIDEDAFEEFLDEHPELEETYEAIEETLVRRGLISKETFSRAGARFKSSTVAKHLMVAVIMFSAGAALMFGVKSLPDDLEDEGMMYLGIVGFMYTAYSVHSVVKKAVNPPDTE